MQHPASPRNDHTPTVEEISEILTRELESLSPGHRLATEQELMRRFRVSRTALRKVMDNLESRLLIRRIQGSGTFVNRRIDYLVSTHSVSSIRSTAGAVGARGDSRVLSIRSAPLPHHLLELMDMREEKTTLVLNRLGFLDDQPALWTEDWIIPEVAQTLDVSLPVFRSVSDSLRAHGFSPRRARSLLTVEDIPPQALRDLRLREPALGHRLLTGISDADSGEPLILSETWFRLDSVRLVFDHT